MDRKACPPGLLSAEIRTGAGMKREHIITILCTWFLCVLMVGISEVCGQRELLFPDLAALAAGLLLSPAKLWRTDGKRVVFLVTLSAALGWGITAYLQEDLWLKLSLAFLAGQLLLLFSGTDLTPVVSVIVFPVLLDLKSPLMVAAAFFSSLFVTVLRFVLEKRSVKAAERFLPVEKPTAWEIYDFMIRLCAVTLLGVLIRKTGWTLLAAPPLLAVFTEGTGRGRSLPKGPVRILVTYVVCALIGSLFRGVLSLRFGLPLTLAALPAVFCMLSFVLLTSPLLPSAGTMTLLAFLIPPEEVVRFPLEALAGGALLFLWIRCFFKKTPDRLETQTAHPFRREKEQKAEGNETAQ